jgi:putative endonuclease
MTTLVPGDAASAVAAAAQPAERPSWHVYLLECEGGKFYAGITNDLAARFAAHVRGTGAKFTRANPPLRVLASRPYDDRSLASKAEYALKQLPRAKKMGFFAHA